MLIPISQKTIYNTETNTFIRLRDPNENGGVSILFYNGEDIHAVSKDKIAGVRKAWKTLYRVAELQIKELEDK